jgi:hypothetical protein
MKCIVLSVVLAIIPVILASCAASQGLGLEEFVGPLIAELPYQAAEESRIILLHHSVGRIVYAHDIPDPYDGYVDSDCSDGDCDGLAQWFYDYSQTNGVDYQIYEAEWPSGHGQNDPAVYEDIFVGSGCSEAALKPGSEEIRTEIGNVCSLDDLSGFDVIILKTCYTESGIDYTVMQRYMENYNALGQEFDQYPGQSFVLWNLFPNLSGTTYDRQFSEWLRDSYAPIHTNVYVWDVFESMTYSNSNSFYSGYAWGGNHPTPAAGELLALGGENAAGETVVGLGDFIIGAIPHDVTMSLSLTAEPTSLVVYPGETATYTLSVTASEGFSVPVTLSLQGAPADTTASFSPNPVTPPDSSDLYITTTALTAAGTFSMTAVGSAGEITDTANMMLSIVDCPFKDYLPMMMKERQYPSD